MMQRYEQRREKLRALMREKNLAGMLVTLDANRYYLSGFELMDHQTNESSGCIVLTADGKDWLCTDSRYEEAACRLWERERVFIYSGVATAAEQINTLLKDNVRGTVGFEAHGLNVAFYEIVSEGLSMQKADGLVEKLRVIKDSDEVALMEAACALNHKLMEWLPGVLVYGRTEKQLAWDVEQFFRNHGASSLSFDSIIAINTNAALPHAIPGESKIDENCCVLVDVGCRLNDYCSDQTRTFWVGNNPKDYFLHTLEQVKEAQRLAIEAMRPGMTCKDIYGVAYKYFESQGVEKNFNHGLGHGIGLQTHEPPSLNPRSDVVLEPGMIITVEPGLYYPTWGGIRWEYMLLVTEDGARAL